MKNQNLAFVLLALIAAIGCAAQDRPVVLRDNDDFTIPEPVVDEQGEYIWSDGAYYMSVHQLKKPLDLGWILTSLNVLEPTEAENVNALDQVPDSTWFTNRHAVHRLTVDELARGPASDEPPTGPWTVLKGKDLGVNPGFVARDDRGRLLFVKFDPPEYPGLGTNADVLVSRFLHAAGYNTPAYHAVQIDAAQITLSPDATIPGKHRVKRPMTQIDLDRILANAPRTIDGRLLANVSVGLTGKPKGPFDYWGLRADDPNDTVRHENRRELRGLRLFMAWLNNHDSRRGNTLDMYVDEGGRRFLRHYLIDFSGGLGSSNIAPKNEFEGHEYFIDPGTIARSLVSFGLWIKPWEVTPLEPSPALGHIDSATFAPEDWRGSYANPAFERMTTRDGFWAARIITSFSDTDIRAIVDTGLYVGPDDASYLSRVLAQRRDVIRDHWLSGERISPLDDFTVEDGGSWFSLRFEDVRRARVDEPRYRVRQSDGTTRIVGRAQIPLPPRAGIVEIQAQQETDRWGPLVSVSVALRNGKPYVAAVER